MGSYVSFGSVIPVTGPNLGFPGNVSRFGERVITARVFTPTTSSNLLLFGAPTVLIPDSAGGHFDSVADFIAAAAANVANLAAYFAGFAVREVKTQLGYPQVPGVPATGYYGAGQMSEVLERGSVTTPVAVANSVQNGSQAYTRVVLNGAVTAGLIGDVEVGAPAATDLFTQEATTQTQGSTSVTLASGTNTVNGQLVSGVGIQTGTYIVSGGGTTAIVLNKAAQLTSAGNILTFSNLYALDQTVARTGYVDANSLIELTIKRRVAA